MITEFVAKALIEREEFDALRAEIEEEVERIASGFAVDWSFQCRILLTLAVHALYNARKGAKS